MLSEKQINQPFSERLYDNQHLINKLRDSNNRIDNELEELKKVTYLKPKKRKALTDTNELKTFNDVTVTRLLAKRFAVPFNESNYSKCIRELQVALLSLSAFIIITALSWITISNTNFLTSSDFSYNAGLFGGFLMLCSVFYALLKRVKFIYAMGHNETWFYAHLVCGVAGTMIIFFHTTFQIKSLNSAIAFGCLMVVMVSGMFGRYICTLLSFQLQKIYDRIGEYELDLINTFVNHSQSSNKEAKQRLSKLLATGMGKKKNLREQLIQLFYLPKRALSFYLVMANNIKTLYKAVAERNQWNDLALKNSITDGKKIARQYTKNIILLSLTQFLSDILSHWRIIHTSTLYLLTLTATGHIIAIHMY